MKRRFVSGLVFVFGMAFLLAAEAAAEPRISTPIIATTCGQSPGGTMIRMAAMQAKLADVTENKALTAADITGKGFKTLIVTTGTSMKGMGAAGTDVDKEIERCTALISAAKAEGMVVIGAHIEGQARMVDAMDDASIRAVMPLADFILVINDSNKNGFFTNYANQLGKELVQVRDALSVGTKLEELSR
jgi:hypothetical protein